MTWHPAVTAEHVSRGIVAGATMGTVFGLDGPAWLNIGLALIVGMVARYAIMQSLNRRIRWTRELGKDLMIAPANALMAARFVETMQWDGLQAALAIALFGGSSTIIFAALLSAFQNRHLAAPIDVFLGPDEVTRVPPEAPKTEVHSVGKRTAQSTPRLMVQELRAEEPVADPDPGLERLLKKLEKKD